MKGNVAVQENLVIISVPFYRIAKVSLSSLVLDALNDNGDILIVSPFSEEPRFKKNFHAKNIFYLKWSKKFSKYKILLLGVSEIMRRNGYWRKYKNHGLLYYLKNQFNKFGPDGKDTKLNMAMCFIYWWLSIIGKVNYSWLLVERIINGKKWYQFPLLVEFAKKYNKVVLIQSANWGLQDRALSRLSMEQGWKTILLPYTSDQIAYNGYLLNKFNIVCVPGSFEYNFAKNIQNIAVKNICRLGNCWFRNLEKIKSTLDIPTKKTKTTIIYAGISNLYYNSQDEFDSVDAILDFISCAKKSYKLIYRPVEFVESRRKFIEKKYGDINALELQWPTNADLGLAQYHEINQSNALRKYVTDLSSCDLLIMSLAVSLCLDAAFLNKCGVISNMVDSYNTLKRRHSHIFPMDLLSGVRIVKTIPELLYNIKDLLNNPEKGRKEAMEIISQWDYPDINFQATLSKIVYDV
jgi:hypothetical protein